MQIFILFLTSLFFYSATVHSENKKTVGIVTYKVMGVNPWDPDSVNSGITGSEEAVIYMSQKLAELGYKVTVLGDPPANSKHSRLTANPRFVDLDKDNGSSYDICVLWRMPWSATKWKKRAKKVYLWPHDSNFYSVPEEEIRAFDDILWLTKWQREQWLVMNPKFAIFKKIYGNGINPDQFAPVSKRSNPYSCIYGSNYAMGLEYLLDIWPSVHRRFPQATLDIYYGWQHWGLLSPQQENKMKEQIIRLESKGVTEHGLVSHEVLNRAYESSAFWTYPCSLNETFCITALRAQLSGATPVTIRGSGFNETVRNGYQCNKRHEYFALLIKAMSEAENTTVEQRANYGKFILNEFTWEKMALKWKNTFEKK